MNDPNALWYAVEILWLDELPDFNQLGWLREVANKASYAKPALGLQYRYSSEDWLSLPLNSSPQVYVGYAFRDSTDAGNVKTWFTAWQQASGEDNPPVSFSPGPNPFGFGPGNVMLPRCWCTMWLDRPELFKLDETRNPDNVSNLWPLWNQPPAYDSGSGQWLDGDDPPPFLNWPPCRNDLQVGIVIAVANRPATWKEFFTGTIHARPSNWVHDARSSWKLRMTLRSACVTAIVRPNCQAWFSQEDSLTLSVPDAFPPKIGRYPVEPVQWRGMSFLLQRQRISLAGVGDDHWRPEWAIAPAYWRDCFFGTLNDPDYTNDVTLNVFYVPCVAMWLYIVPNNPTECPFMIVIYHDTQGPNVSPDNDSIDQPAGGVAMGVFVGEPWETETAPWFYFHGQRPSGLGEDQLFEPSVAPISYDPIAIAYRVAVFDYYFGNDFFATNKCRGDSADPCHPDATKWSCGRTLLQSHGFSANYVTTETPTGFVADQFWLWLELRSS